MESVTQAQPKITFTVDTEEASDIIAALGLLTRSRLGAQAERCGRLSNYLWAQAFHDLGRGRAA
jgi:hypothetical protein